MAIKGTEIQGVNGSIFVNPDLERKVVVIEVMERYCVTKQSKQRVRLNSLDLSIQNAEDLVDAIEIAIGKVDPSRAREEY